MKITSTTLPRLKQLRDIYFRSLPEFQELFLELMVPGSEHFVLQINAGDAGYAIRNSEGILIEFYLGPPYILQSPQIFEQVLQELSINEIYCKSFDSLLLNCCLSTYFPHSIIGVLYRDYTGSPVTLNPEIQKMKADLSSVDHLMEQEISIRELFETREQLVQFIEKEKVFEFYHHKKFVGCGMVIRTHPDWDYCDLGLWVHPLSRRRGIGSQIILHLKKFAEGSGLEPSCGCAVENIASQKTIEKSGYVSKHKLIRFMQPDHKKY